VLADVIGGFDAEGWVAEQLGPGVDIDLLRALV
jgi:hypothetical protein